MTKKESRPESNSSAEIELGNSQPVLRPVTRRLVLKGGGSVMLTAMVPLAGCGTSEGPASVGNGFNPPDGLPPDQPPVPTLPVSFLTDDELVTLRALVDRFIPGVPEDATEGAVAGNCAEAIGLLLGAFLTNPPFIYAGGPFSDRGGATENDFLEFLELDPYEELAWRLAVEGSLGLPEREFNGPVRGMQTIYREGLAQLEARAQQSGGMSFSATPAAGRDAIIADTNDALVQELVDISFPDTIEAMYGPPEYGGNANLVGWTTTVFNGDVHPRGFTDDQVINADEPGALDFLLPPSFSETAENSSGFSAQAALNKKSPVTPVASGEPEFKATASNQSSLAFLAGSDSIAAAIAAADGSMRKLREQLAPWTVAGNTVAGRVTNASDVLAKFGGHGHA